jgi:hypothetical protein
MGPKLSLSMRVVLMVVPLVNSRSSLGGLLAQRLCGG